MNAAIDTVTAMSQGLAAGRQIAGTAPDESAASLIAFVLYRLWPSAWIRSLPRDRRSTSFAVLEQNSSQIYARRGAHTLDSGSFLPLY